MYIFCVLKLHDKMTILKSFYKHRLSDIIHEMTGYKNRNIYNKSTQNLKWITLHFKTMKVKQQSQKLRNSIMQLEKVEHS